MITPFGALWVRITSLHLSLTALLTTISAEWLSRMTRNHIPSGASVRIWPTSSFCRCNHHERVSILVAFLFGADVHNSCEDPAKTRVWQMICILSRQPYTKTSSMPPRPFPFPFRVGTDICSVARVRAIITRHNEGGPLHPLRHFMKRVLTDPERRYFWDRFANTSHAEILTQASAVSTFLAGRCVYTAPAINLRLTRVKVRCKRSLPQSMRSSASRLEGLPVHYDPTCQPSCS
jgi:hypothetical protein